MTKQFPCVACGLCCRNLDETIYADLRLPDGTCMYYDADRKLCSVYDARPLKCRIDDYYAFYLENEMDIEHYYEMNIEACKNMMLLFEDYDSYTKILVKMNQID